jgi:hypothetical protein
MYIKPNHPELAEVAMSVLSQVLSASSCERNWSSHGYIHSKVRNRLVSSSLGKLVYVYLNSKMMMKSRDDEELKILAWDNLNEESLKTFWLMDGLSEWIACTQRLN